ncbi:P-loop containing nucleoside triphosphate hydrolase protein [Haematococcus lacustris]
MHATAYQCCSRQVIVRPVALAGAARAQQDSFTYLPLSLPEPLNSRVTKSQFLKSSKAVSECPRNSHPEFAVIGRSNVGKSSLINTLTGNDKLAKVSKEPGATKLINHFLIDDGWCLVDLPGYGFSKTAGKAAREEWLSFTKDFFISRDALVHVLLLVDASLPPQAVDIDCANWLAECQVPFCIVFTKVDNRKKDLPTPAANIKAFKTMLAADWEALPWCFETSSRTGTGKAQLLGYLASLRQLHRLHQGQ